MNDYFDWDYFDRIEAAREFRIEGGLEYEEWRERIHARDEDDYDDWYEEEELTEEEGQNA